MADDVNATQTWFSLEEPLLHPMIFETFGDQRYTQDSPIMPDVWIAFLHAPRRTVDVLLTPRSGDSPSRLAKRLAERLAIYAGLKPSADESWTDPVWAAHCIAYSRSSVVASVTFNELIHVVVPMTTWWSAGAVMGLAAQARRPRSCRPEMPLGFLARPSPRSPRPGRSRSARRRASR